MNNEIKKSQVAKVSAAFLQSKVWRKLQESVGRKTHLVETEGFSASIVEHMLPIVGTYFYVPRGPVYSLGSEEFPISNSQLSIKSEKPIFNEQKQGIQKVIDLAKKENAGWVRIEPENEEVLKTIIESISEKVVKAPHDMQPKEIFVMDITKSSETLLAEMKSKTRYNIGVAMKKGVAIKTWTKNNEKAVEAFLNLTKEMALRNGITAHPENYYRKMLASFPEDMLKIYVAEYAGKIIAANLVLFYGETATYLHGASSNDNRNVMAPYLLQWQAILDAKERGHAYYDFGGVHTIQGAKYNSWEGITHFKLGFSLETKPVVFPGSYDIIINSRAYALYRGLQKAKTFLPFLHRTKK